MPERYTDSNQPNEHLEEPDGGSLPPVAAHPQNHPDRAHGHVHDAQSKNDEGPHGAASSSSIRPGVLS